MLKYLPAFLLISLPAMAQTTAPNPPTGPSAALPYVVQQRNSAMDAIVACYAEAQDKLSALSKENAELKRKVEELGGHHEPDPRFTTPLEKK